MFLQSPQVIAHLAGIGIHPSGELAHRDRTDPEEEAEEPHPKPAGQDPEHVQVIDLSHGHDGRTSRLRRSRHLLDLEITGLLPSPSRR